MKRILLGLLMLIPFIGMGQGSVSKAVQGSNLQAIYQQSYIKLVSGEILPIYSSAPAYKIAGTDTIQPSMYIDSATGKLMVITKARTFISVSDSAGVKRIADSLANFAQFNGTSGIGDQGFDSVSLIVIGDSKKENWQNVGSASDWITTVYRVKGQPLERLKYMVNFGASGYTALGWLTDPLQTLPSINLYTNLGVSQWDGFGHKPTGAISLKTQIQWKKTNDPKGVSIWTGACGTNDEILYANIGNMRVDSLATYLAGLIDSGTRLILQAFPNDKIVWSIPCAMVARPTNPAFPSTTAYPDWGASLSTDSARMAKWNMALRLAYNSIRGKYPNVKVIDYRNLVYGNPDPTILATSLPFMNDLVHNGTLGNRKEADELVNALVPPKFLNQSRIAEAEAEGTARSLNPWDIYPAYFYQNPKYSLVLKAPNSIVAGSNYIDLSLAKGDWDKYVAGRAFYISVSSGGAQYFSSYTITSTGTTTLRIGGVVPNAALQALPAGEVYIYIDALIPLSSDAYVTAQVQLLKPRKVIYGAIVTKGVGFFDLTFDANYDRNTTDRLQGINTGTLIIGGTTITNITDFNTYSATKNGASTARGARFTKSGLDTSLFQVGTKIAIAYGDAAIPPQSYEAQYPYYSETPRSVGNISRLTTDKPLPQGVTINVNNTEVYASPITVEIFRIQYPNRTSLGTITIPANSGTGSTPIVISTNVVERTTFECVINTASASSTTDLVVMGVKPN